MTYLIKNQQHEITQARLQAGPAKELEMQREHHHMQQRASKERRNQPLCSSRSIFPSRFLVQLQGGEKRRLENVDERRSRIRRTLTIVGYDHSLPTVESISHALSRHGSRCSHQIRLIWSPHIWLHLEAAKQDET